MDEFLMYKYLNEKGANSREEQDFMNKFKKFVKAKRAAMKRHDVPFDEYNNYNWEDDNYDDDHEFFEKYRRGMRNTMGIDEEEEYRKMMKYMRDSMGEDSLSESKAKHLVSQMYHIENGRKHVGEKYDMHKAKEICERYKGMIPSNVKYPELYVAINAQYHDYCELFKSWFGDNMDSKIVESAIIFWFRDVDYPEGNKIMEYFNV